MSILNCSGIIEKNFRMDSLDYSKINVLSQCFFMYYVK